MVRMRNLDGVRGSWYDDRMNLRSIAALILAAFLATLAPAPTLRPTTSTTISEDDPGWNCRTMGNHLCGPQEVTR